MLTNENQRERLLQLLGDTPGRSKSVEVVSSEKEERETYRLEKLVLRLNGLEDVPAYFVTPKEDEQAEPYPVVLFNHSHGGNHHIGKEELLSGTTYLQVPHYAESLTKLGYAALCIDAWGFGDRFTRSESDIFKEMLWKGQVMWGMMVYDSMRAIDYLHTRDDVDTNRIGTLGISMGGLMAWWLSALDERIKVCIDLCSLADFQAVIDTDALRRHGIYYYVPGIMKHFTTTSINALIAPRPHLSLAGHQDDLIPKVGTEKIDQEMQAIYRDAGAPEAWKFSGYDVGHEETPGMRQEVEAWLKKYL